MKQKWLLLITILFLSIIPGHLFLPCEVASFVVLAAEPQLPLVLDGEWPCYGYTSDQSRNKLKDSAILPDQPSLLWSTKLPYDRFTGFLGDSVIGPDDTIYIPFFGRGWHTGGVQAITPDGRQKWYFKSPETEIQAPLVTRTSDNETLIIFGNARSMVALYDKEECRCCVERKPDNAENQYDHCNFICEPDSGKCEPGHPDYDPEHYEWRHRLYDVDGQRCGNGVWNRECGAWHIEKYEINPPQTTPELKLEVCASPILAQDGRTVYYLVGRPNYVVAIDAQTGLVKWSLNEDSPNGWIGEACPDLEPEKNKTFDDPAGVPVLLSDGSFVFGTSGSCLVRIVDHGSYGRAEGVYQYAAGSPVMGLCSESMSDGNDNLYVATHGMTPFNEGYLYKTNKERLLQGSGPLWVYRASRAVTERPGIDMGGIWRSPALADVGGTKYVYACVVDLPKGNPDRGWVVRIPAEDGPGTYRVIMGRYDYQNDIVAALKVNGSWFPGQQCTIDSLRRIYIHGGKNRPMGGKILRLNSDLSGLTSILDTARSNSAEIVLGQDYLVAVAIGAWFPKFFFLPRDFRNRFAPIVYKLGNSTP